MTCLFQRQSKCGKRPVRSWQGCRTETKGRVAESTARTTFAVVVGGIWLGFAPWKSPPGGKNRHCEKVAFGPL
jgi:hypothetical protein